MPSGVAVRGTARRVTRSSKAVVQANGKMATVPEGPHVLACYASPAFTRNASPHAS